MPMYHLIEYSDNYAKTSGRLWHYFRNEPDGNNIAKPGAFKFKLNLTYNSGNFS